jgi:alkanesulfonate monooxygenase SsuD/methylene tetrahydromethanopterin reductase-like flavin-dependent oxidoreductase (luciferase family)
MEFCPNLMRADIDPVAWAIAREAEGWDVIAASDHLWVRSGVAFPHLWVTLTQMAMVTSRVRLTSSFANNLFRSPVEFAQASLALQRASGGRFEASWAPAGPTRRSCGPAGSTPMLRRAPGCTARRS